MHRFALAAVVVALVAGCGPGTAGTTTTSEPATASTTAPSTTTTTELAVPGFAALASAFGSLEGVPDGPLLLSGIGRRIGAAFDDVGGGIVFEQTIDGQWQTFHLEAGRREPTELGVPGTRLGDVDFLANRPVTAAMWDQDAILLQVVRAGAPDVLVTDDLPIGAGEVSGVSLSEEVMAVATLDGECHDVTLLTTTGELVAGPFGLCAATPPQITSDGSLIAHLDFGASTRVVFVDPGSGAEVARQQVAMESFSLTTSTTGAVVLRPDGIDHVTPDGVVATLDWDPTGIPVAASALRAPLVVSDLATLGGDAVPTDCSASGLPSLAAQTGLSPLADRQRTAMAEAAIACDFISLSALAAVDFDGPDDLAVSLARAEVDGIPVLGDIVRTLGLPHAAVGTSPDIEFVWPSILGDQPTDQDWDALRLVYNEERIEEWLTGRGPFDGMSVTITEDGRWTGLGGFEPGAGS